LFLRPHDLAHQPTGIAGFIETAKPFLPIAIMLAVVPLLRLFFGKTWRELDGEAQDARGAMLRRGETDYRPLVAMVMVAIVLTMQEYYGGRLFYDTTLRPLMFKYELNHPNAFRLDRFDELYGFGWWALTRVVGYTMPLFLWKVFFRNDSLLDFGFRIKGFFDHIWIYALFLAVVLPAMFVVSRAPDFGTYYPFYKNSQRSWLDFLLWESMYFAQFFALEVFFRGFWLGALRKSFGSGAIFSMAVPYCMIHYGKPYLEAAGAIIAGIALGSLSMKTKSIYQGFLVHITVAGLMDILSLSHRGGLPHVFWPPV